ncbi:MAG: ribosome-associated translation inhibitor RaiA [Bacteroidales bacterium]|nr:ribosome-associated translation inhibitor RaiA [Bacteroidales bacterium]
MPLLLFFREGMEALHQSVDRFLDYLRYERNQSDYTLVAYRTDLLQYIAYVEQLLGEGFVPSEGDRDLIRGFLVSLMEKGMKSSSVHRKVSSIKSYYLYLVKIGLLEHSPARLIRSPRGEKPLPAVLSELEIEHLLGREEIDEADFLSLRNYLVLEMLYQTGMRRGELVGLREDSVDLTLDILKVFGKGRKERIVPFGKDLSRRITQYLTLKHEKIGLSRFFFVTLSNQPLGGEDVYRIVHERLQSVPGLARRGPHVLRHTFATTMLSNGAELMAVKELLGHKSVSTTVLYTHTSLAELQQMYNAHPRASKKKSIMEVRIQSIHFTASAALEEFVQKKLDRLDRLYGGVVKAEVILKVAKSEDDKNKEASIRLEVPGPDLFAEKQAPSFEEAIDLVVDALKRQIDKLKEQH